MKEYDIYDDVISETNVLYMTRIQKERFITKVETVKLPTDYAEFELTCYKDEINDK